MKGPLALAVFGVAVLLAAPVAAQSQVDEPDGGFPYDPPPGFKPQNPSQVPLAPAATAGAEETYGPSTFEVPDEVPAAEPNVDLGADDAIADSYDDGYDPNAYTQFEETLSPYGSWIDDVAYGRIWVPAIAIVGDGFAPYYTGGRWALTEYGWTWISDWGWGWAPFHYGRWLALAGHGWCWVPGTTWGPAWVSWRSGGGWVGWAPLPPRGVRVVAEARSGWRFTQARSLGAPRATAVPGRRANGLFARTSVVANDRLLTRGPYSVRVNAGPVQGSSVAPVQLATVAPRALPTVRILPRPGTAVGGRSWVQVERAPGRGAAGGAGAVTRGGSGAGPLLRSPPPFRHTPAPFGRAGTPPEDAPPAVGHAPPSAGHATAPTAFNEPRSGHVADPAPANPRPWGAPERPSFVAPAPAPSFTPAPQPRYSAPQAPYAPPRPAVVTPGPASTFHPAPAQPPPVYHRLPTTPTPTGAPIAEPVSRPPVFRGTPPQSAPAPAPRFGAGTFGQPHRR